MMMKNPDMLKNLLIAGSAAAFLLSTLFATVVFDKVSPNTTVSDQQIEMGMQVMATDQHIEVWMDAVLLLHTIVDIVNISKIDEDGNAEEGTIVDLFPVGSPATGRGTVIFKILSLDKKNMPNLSNFTQASVPMAYVRAETLNEFVKSFLRLASVGIKYFKFMSWMMVFTSLGMIGAGAGLLYLDKKKTPVTSIVEPDAE